MKIKRKKYFFFTVSRFFRVSFPQQLRVLYELLNDLFKNADNVIIFLFIVPLSLKRRFGNKMKQSPSLVTL